MYIEGKNVFKLEKETEDRYSIGYKMPLKFRQLRQFDDGCNFSSYFYVITDDVTLITDEIYEYDSDIDILIVPKEYENIYLVYDRKSCVVKKYQEKLMEKNKDRLMMIIKESKGNKMGNICENIGWFLNEDRLNEQSEILCPECNTWTAVTKWKDCEPGCADCGSHVGIECPECEYWFDHCWDGEREFKIRSME
jgi:hypothetical protein